MDRYYSSAPDTPKNNHIDLNPTPSDLNRVHIQHIDHYRENHVKDHPPNNNYNQNGDNRIQSIYKNRARSGSSDNAQDMTKVKLARTCFSFSLNSSSFNHGLNQFCFSYDCWQVMCDLTVNNVFVNPYIPNMQVKQLSNDLISLISQLESDFRENENSFKQKIKSELSEVWRIPFKGTGNLAH